MCAETMHNSRVVLCVNTRAIAIVARSHALSLADPGVVRCVRSNYPEIFFLKSRSTEL